MENTLLVSFWENELEVVVTSWRVDVNEFDALEDKLESLDLDEVELGNLPVRLVEVRVEVVFVAEDGSGLAACFEVEVEADCVCPDITARVLLEGIDLL